MSVESQGRTLVEADMTSVVDDKTLKRFDQDGFVVVASVLSTHEIGALVGRLSDDQGFALRRGGAVFAVRNALCVPAVSEIARSRSVRAKTRRCGRG